MGCCFLSHVLTKADWMLSPHHHFYSLASWPFLWERQTPAAERKKLPYTPTQATFTSRQPLVNACH